MCTATHRTAGENKATRSPPHWQRLCSNAQATDQSWESQSRTGPSDSSCNVAPGRRTWQINLSLHYLSNCVNKKSDVIFRRPRQNAMTQTTNPPGPFMSFQRRQIISQVLLQFIARGMQQPLI